MVFFAPLQQREVDHPEAFKPRLISQPEPVAHLQTELAELLARLVCLATENQHQVARLGAEGCLHGLQLLLGEILVDARLDVSVRLHAGVDETLGPDLRPLHKLGQFVELLARVGGCALSPDAGDVVGTVEDDESVSLHQVGDLHETHAEAQVGLVGAVILHGVVPRHAREGLAGELHAEDGAEEVAHHALKERDDVVLLHEAHLAVDLRELRLTVGAEVFVAEAFYDLEIAVEAGDHQQLLERLRRLWQGIELPRVHARRHDKVARALRRGVDQNGGLHLQEMEVAQVSAHLERHAMAQL